MQSSNQNNSENGFTLVEITIVMIISGLILAAFVSSYLRWQTLLHRSQTQESISIIADALSAYAARNYRIPCPADPSGAGTEPFGVEIGSDRDGDGDVDDLGVCDTIALAEGIVPFATLGLDATLTRDGWGNYFTYQISPAYAQDMDIETIDITATPLPVLTIPVHAKCRTTEWIEGTTMNSGVLYGGRNLTPQKARFCCVQANTNNPTQIFSTPAPTNTPSIIYTPEVFTGLFDFVNKVADPLNSSDPLVNNDASGTPQPYYGNNVYGGGVGGISGHTDLPAYAIISHGQNGAGAFIGNGTTNRTAGGGTSEQVNADSGDQIIYDLPHNSSNGATYYDDIVSWQTPSELLARLRRDSCALP